MGRAAVERSLIGPADRDRAVMVVSVVPPDDQAVDEERLEDIEDRGLVAAADVGRGGERPADLPPELAVELDALVEELLQLPGHGAVIGGGAEDDAIVAEEVGGGRVLDPLQVHLEAFRLEDLRDPGRHSLCVPRPGIIGNEGFGHEIPPGLRRLWRREGG